MKLRRRTHERLCRWLCFGYFDSDSSQIAATGKLAYAAIFVGRVLLIMLAILLLLMRGKLHVMHMQMRNRNRLGVFGDGLRAMAVGVSGLH